MAQLILQKGKKGSPFTLAKPGAVDLVALGRQGRAKAKKNG